MLTDLNQRQDAQTRSADGKLRPQADGAERRSNGGGLTRSATMGRNIMMVAVLLANSVKQATKPVISITAAAGGTSARGWTWPPIHLASPDSCQTPQDGGQGSKIRLQHNQTRAKPSRAGGGGGSGSGALLVLSMRRRGTDFPTRPWVCLSQRACRVVARAVSRKCTCARVSFS